MEQSNDQALALVKQSDLLIPPKEVMAALKEQADMMVAAGMLPPGYETGAQVLMVSLRGRELGCGFWESVQGMFPMKGKDGKGGRIGYMGTFMLAQIARRYPRSKHRIIQNDDKGCVIETSKNGNDEWLQVEVTSAEAAAAGWDVQWQWDDAAKRKLPVPKAVWKARANMLYWRTVSRMTNRLYSDVFGQPVYTREELEDGEPDYIAPEPGASKSKIAPGFSTAEDAQVVTPAAAPAPQPEPAPQPAPAMSEKLGVDDMHAQSVEQGGSAPELPLGGAPKADPPPPTQKNPEAAAKVASTIDKLKADLAKCATANDVRNVWDAFKKSGANGAELTTGFQERKLRLAAIEGGK